MVRASWLGMMSPQSCVSHDPTMRMFALHAGAGDASTAGKQAPDRQALC